MSLFSLPDERHLLPARLSQNHWGTTHTILLTASGAGRYRSLRSRLAAACKVDSMVPGLNLSEDDRNLLDGEGGEAARLAMRIVLALAGAVGAERLIDVTAAHVDGCLYHGQASLDFAERLAAGGARV